MCIEYDIEKTEIKAPKNWLRAFVRANRAIGENRHSPATVDGRITIGNRTVSSVAQTKAIKIAFMN